MKRPAAAGSQTQDNLWLELPVLCYLVMTDRRPTIFTILYMYCTGGTECPRIVRVSDRLAVLTQWQDTGGSSQGCPGFDSRQPPAFSLSSIFASLHLNLFPADALDMHFASVIWQYGLLKFIHLTFYRDGVPSEFRMGQNWKAMVQSASRTKWGLKF